MTRMLGTILVLCGMAAADPAPPAPLTARVIKVEVMGGDTIVTAAMGSDQGISKTATCKFLDAANQPRPDDCILIRVDHRTTIVKTHMTADQLRVSGQVRFTLH